MFNLISFPLQAKKQNHLSGDGMIPYPDRGLDLRYHIVSMASYDAENDLIMRLSFKFYLFHAIICILFHMAVKIFKGR